MRFCVLGPLEVCEAGRAVAIGGGRQRALLALLLVHAGEIVSRDRLIHELWNGAPGAGASQSLDAYLSRLRRAFRDAGADGILETRAPGYLLRAEDTDSARFEAMVGEGRAALAAREPKRACELLRGALELWRGKPYVEAADEPWAGAEIDRLEELRLSAIEARAEAELTLGSHAALVPELEMLAERNPTRERLVGQLMLALYRCGRQADALAAYRAARRFLVDELGIEPGPELRGMEAAVLAQDPALDLPREASPEPPALQPIRRRRVRGAALIAAAVAGVTLAALLALAGGGAASRRTIAANGAGAIDPVNGRVAASVHVGSSPAGIASGVGRIWVSNGADGTVSRIDPDGARVDQTIAVGTSPAGIAAGAGAIWVANALDGSVSRIDPRGGRVVQTIQVGRRPVGLIVGAGAVWVVDANGDAVVPLDPATGVPRRPVPLDSSPRGIAVGFGALWVTEPVAHKLVRIDPRTGETLAEIDVGAGAGPVAAGAGAVWVVNTLDGTLARVDPTRNAVTSAVPAGDAPSAVAAGAGGVWVADEGAGNVVSMNPRTGGVEHRYAVGASPVGVTLSGRTPWVAAGAPVGRAHRGGTLRAEYEAFSRLDPALPFPVHPGIWRATGDSLVALAESLGAAEVVPDLATSVPRPTDGGRTYAFRLRPGLRYSTGVPVRPSDFRRQFERLFAVHSEAASFYSSLRGAAACARRPAECDLSQGVIADDPAGTVTLRLSRPDPDLLFTLALPASRPVPPGTPRAVLATGAVPSTGPYRVGDFVPGRRLLLVRNERYHEWSRAAQPDGYPDRIDIQMADDPNVRLRAVLRGSADLALEVADANIAPLRVRFASQVRQHTQPDTSFFSFNVRRRPFDDVRARRAVNLAIDRGALAARSGGSGLSTPTCQILPPHFTGHQDYCPWTRPPFDGRWHGADIRRARALVHRSGTAGATVKVIAQSGDPTAPSAARLLVATLRRIGYRAHVSVLVRPAAPARRSGGRGSWSIAAGDWVADYPSPGEFLDYFLSCASYRPDDPARSTNSGGFCHPGFDRLVAKAGMLQLTDPARAQAVWARADRLAVDLAAWAPIVSTSSIEFVSRRTGNFKLDANSQPEIDQLWVR
jgi:YVTN family beta-propeller protein